VGSVLHCWIKAPAPAAAGTADDATRALWIGTVPTFEDLDALMERFAVDTCVIDALPEGHKVAEFIQRFPGRVFRCFYPNVAQWRQDDPVRWDDDEHTVLAHRTQTLDATFARCRRRFEQLPQEAPCLPGVFAQLKAPVRIVTKDAAGRDVAVYDEGSAADHYAHALNYACIAQAAPRTYGVLVQATARGW
jgi:hypothetical protein